MKPIYAIGDVHGCYDQACRAIDRINEYHQSHNYNDNPRIVWLGDYTDRGPNSKGVIDLLMSRNDEYIRGNHDQAFIESYTDVNDLHQWLFWGAVNTLLSYGHDRDNLMEVVNRIAQNQGFDISTIDLTCIPQSHVDWLNSLPHKIETENHFFCHAGIHPEFPLNEQSTHTLMWIRERFLRSNKDYGKHVVHGHSIIGFVDHFTDTKNRTNLDNGAYHRGILLVGVFDDDVPGGKCVDKLYVS